MKTVIIETIRYELEVKDEAHMQLLQEREDNGLDASLGDEIAEGRAKLMQIHRTIKEKW